MKHSLSQGLKMVEICWNEDTSKRTVIALVSMNSVQVQWAMVSFLAESSGSFYQRLCVLMNWQLQIQRVVILHDSFLHV